MGYANSTLTKPFTTTVDLVKNALGLTLARPFTATQIFASDKINMWSKRKPVKVASPAGPIDMGLAAYGFTVTKATSQTQMITQGRAFAENKRTVGGISYAPPTTGPRRWSDWNDYSTAKTAKPWSTEINGDGLTLSAAHLVVAPPAGIMGMADVQTAISNALGETIDSVGFAYVPAGSADSASTIFLSPTAGNLMTASVTKSVQMTAGTWDVVAFFGSKSKGLPYVVCGRKRITLEQKRQRIMVELEGDYYGSGYQCRLRATYWDTGSDATVPVMVRVEIRRQPEKVFDDYVIEAGNSVSQWYIYPRAAGGVIQISDLYPTSSGTTDFVLGNDSLEW